LGGTTGAVEIHFVVVVVVVVVVFLAEGDAYLVVVRVAPVILKVGISMAVVCLGA